MMRADACEPEADFVLGNGILNKFDILRRKKLFDYIRLQNKSAQSLIANTKNVNDFYEVEKFVNVNWHEPKVPGPAHGCVCKRN